MSLLFPLRGSETYYLFSIFRQLVLMSFNDLGLQIIFQIENKIINEIRTAYINLQLSLSQACSFKNAPRFRGF